MKNQIIITSVIALFMISLISCKKRCIKPIKSEIKSIIEQNDGNNVRVVIRKEYKQKAYRTIGCPSF